MDAIPPPIQAILAIFEGPLRELRFGDIDAAALRRLASDVENSATELEAQQAALNAARQTLGERQEQLLGQAQRALAYARVYAENDEALSAQLAAIHLPRAPKRTKADTAESKPAAAESGNEGSSRKAKAAAANAEENGDVNEPSSAEEAPPAAARRGKRRDSTRSVTREDVLSE